MNKSPQGPSTSHGSAPEQHNPTPFGDRSSSHFAARPQVGAHQEPEDPRHPHYEDHVSEQQGYPEDFLETDEPTEHEAHGVSMPSRGWAMWTISVLILGAGITLMFGRALAPERVLPITNLLSDTGLTPGLLTVLGIIMAITTRLMSRLNDMDRQLAQHADWVYDASTSTGESLEFLMDSQDDMENQRAQSTHRLDGLVNSIANQDQKIASIANTLRMYGKPLSEVSRHVTEISAASKSQAMDMDPRMQSLQTSLGQAIEKISNDVASIRDRLPTDHGATLVLEESRALGEQLLKDIRQTMDSQGAHTEIEDVEGLRAEIDSLQSSIQGLSTTEHAPTADQHSDPGEPPRPATGSTRSNAEGVRDAIAKLRKMKP